MVQQGLDGVQSEFPGDERKGDGDEERNESLDLAVSVRVRFVRRRNPVAHAKNHGEVCNQVGNGVDGIRDQCLRRPNNAADALERCDENIHGHPCDGHLLDVTDRSLEIFFAFHGLIHVVGGELYHLLPHVPHVMRLCDFLI